MGDPGTFNIGVLHTRRVAHRDTNDMHRVLLIVYARGITNTGPLGRTGDSSHSRKAKQPRNHESWWLFADYVILTERDNLLILDFATLDALRNS
jgi:hypothetical protein